MIEPAPISEPMAERLISALEKLAVLLERLAPAQPADPEGLLKIDQVAERLGISRRQVERLIKRGKLPKADFGARSPRFRPADLDRLIASRSTEPRAGRRRL